jgi:hypothetical protein
MFQWKKLGRIVDPETFGASHWLREFAQSPSALELDDCVRVYFCARPAPSADGQYQSHMSYVDLDKSDLTKVISLCDHPVLSLGAFGTFDEFGTYPISVIRHADEIRTYYAGITRCESVPFNAAIGLAISHDNGKTFSRLGNGPVLSYSPDEPFLLGSPRIRRFNNKWFLWYVAGRAWLRTTQRPEPVYKIRMASSDDGINWTKHGRDLITDKHDSQECQACPDVTYRDGLYHMFFSYRSIHNYKSKAGGYQIGYAFSKDMEHWIRDDAKAGLTVSEHGWDADMANYPHIFSIAGKTYMFYQGNGMGKTGFGVAELVSPENWSLR